MSQSIQQIPVLQRCRAILCPRAVHMPYKHPRISFVGKVLTLSSSLRTVPAAVLSSCKSQNILHPPLPPPPLAQQHHFHHRHQYCTIMLYHYHHNLQSSLVIYLWNWTPRRVVRWGIIFQQKSILFGWEHFQKVFQMKSAHTFLIIGVLGCLWVGYNCFDYRGVIRPRPMLITNLKLERKNFSIAHSQGGVFLFRLVQNNTGTLFCINMKQFWCW